jgi:hypothetical protein
MILDLMITGQGNNFTQKELHAKKEKREILKGEVN